MGQTTLGTKFALINNFAEYPLQFYKQNAPGAATYEDKTADAAVATAAVIEGYGRIELGTLTRTLRVVKPAKASKHKIQVVDTDIVLGTIANGDVATFKLQVTSNDARAEFDSRDSREHRTFRYQVRLSAADTKSTVLAKLAAQIALTKNLFPEADGSGEPFTITFTAAVGGATPAAGTLVLEANDAQLTLALKVDDLNYDSIDLVTGFGFTTLIEQFAGRGTYLQMKNVIRQTLGTNEVEGLSQGRDLPGQRALYTEIIFGTLTDRPDLSGGGAASDVVAQKPDWVLWVSESAANDGDLDRLLIFLGRSTGTKEFVSAAGTVTTTPTAAIAAAIPVATNTDSKTAPQG